MLACPLAKLCTFSESTGNVQKFGNPVEGKQNIVMYYNSPGNENL
jgi:hypothetical protein